MQTVNIKRVDLITKLEANKAEHRETFLAAQTKFRAAVIEKLDDMLADARAGKKVSQHVGLIAPEDHTKDYERIIAMLSMSVDDVIELSQADFRQYVLDEWAWARQFGATVSSYGIANKYTVTDGEED